MLGQADGLRRTFLVAGWACFAGVAFIAQELVRVWHDIAGQAHAQDSVGWLDLSGAAWPSRWLYVAGHAWILAALIPARAARPWDRILFGLLFVGLATVHA